MYQLIIYIPNSHLDEVKAALFAAGAGQYQGYQQCCWQVQGLGQFMPINDAKPTIGEIGSVSHVDEYRVEMICEKQYLEATLKALHQAHPYEVPAFSYWPVNPELR